VLINSVVDGFNAIFNITAALFFILRMKKGGSIT
jgi:hypothetical protein